MCSRKLVGVLLLFIVAVAHMHRKGLRGGRRAEQGCHITSHNGPPFKQTASTDARDFACKSLRATATNDNSTLARAQTHRCWGVGALVWHHRRGEALPEAQEHRQTAQYVTDNELADRICEKRCSWRRTMATRDLVHSHTRLSAQGHCLYDNTPR